VEVTFVSPPGNYVEQLQAAGFRWLGWSVSRRSLNPLAETLAIVRLGRLYRLERFAVVHHFTIKPILYGTLVARMAGVPWVFNSFTGLGFVFSGGLAPGTLRAIVLPVLRRLLCGRRILTVVQNPEDRERLLRARLTFASQCRLIAGSGVDVSLFRPDHRYEEADDLRVPVVLMACRLLWDKGVAEFVEAARLLRRAGLAADFWLAGAPDPGNPRCVPQKVVEEWAREGVIRWLGHRDDMPELLRQADIAVLPSYHEGLPRFLLEAAATGLPLVATDIPGCRPIVKDGENGFLVSVRDAAALAASVARLVRDPLLRRRMGKASRELAEREFAESVVLEQWVNLYQKALAHDSVPA
jgi:glycosyltransferase involved in cell wall biosynthesis